MRHLLWPSDPTEARHYAQNIFSNVAPRYDTMKMLLSFGQEKKWKRAAFRRLCEGSGGTWIDLAVGTGDVIELALAYRQPSALFALDLRAEMLRRAIAKYPQLENRCIIGDLNALPFRSESADVISLAYGLRYVSNLRIFLSEIHRILRPGGIFIAFDLAHPIQPLKTLWYTYLFLTGSVLGLLLHGRVQTYWHLVESLRAYPGQKVIADLVEEVGFREVTVRSLILGTMAIHFGRKSAS